MVTRQVEFRVTATSAAAPKTVFGLLRSGATWPTWTPIRAYRLVRPGRDGGESVGAVRDFAVGPLHSREQLDEISPDHTLRYSIIGGVPIRHHHAVVELADNGRETTIVWWEGFHPIIPGTGLLLGWLMKRVIRRGADGLASHATSLTP
jgi:hypothetical protein